MNDMTKEELEAWDGMADLHLGEGVLTEGWHKFIKECIVTIIKNDETIAYGGMLLGSMQDRLKYADDSIKTKDANIKQLKEAIEVSIDALDGPYLDTGAEQASETLCQALEKGGK